MTPETFRRQPGGPGAQLSPQPMHGIAVKQAKEE